MLADTAFGVRPHVPTTDGHGTVSVSSWAPAKPARPGRLVSAPAEDGEADGPGVWVLALDPGLWPVRARDLVVEPGTGREWIVTLAVERKHAVAPVMNWINVTAYLR
ncbi:hypothetical protein GCM10022252_75690 [Streptosporangium oxazolinicum]|uniref:Transposase n=2 Tax=Streptosporangium oxazolinicum TaxID=909287 RepID=A0ABP8BKQ8_9ACTN